MLLEHFSTFFTAEQRAKALEEFKEFKQEVVELLPQQLPRRVHDFWIWAFKHFEYKYSCLFKLVRFTQLVPCDTSDCERGFSLMNLLLTALRNRLGKQHLNDLMTICSLGPTIAEFNKDLPAILQLWHAQSKKGRYMSSKFKDIDNV